MAWVRVEMEENGQESKDNGEICCSYLTIVPRMEFLETIEINICVVLHHVGNTISSCQSLKRLSLFFT